MKIAINNSPLKNTHKTRGVGYYTAHLIEELNKDTDVEIQEFTKLSHIKDADVIHYPWFDLFFRTLPIIKQYPTVVTVHDVIPLLFPADYPIGLRGKINLMLQKIALKNCMYIITDSKSSKADIIKYFKIKEEKIKVIPLAAGAEFKVLNNDTESIRTKRKYNLPDRFLLYVGDVNCFKNLPFLIEGLKVLINDPDFADVKLVLIGGAFLKDVEDIEHPELKGIKTVNRLIKQYNLESKIIRPGQLTSDDLVSFYNLATLYVQPSVYEGFGLPVLEAFACGAPVVSSDGGGLPEVGGKAAVYFDPENLNQFVLIVKDLLENVSFRRKLSELGLQQSAKFSWKKTAEETKSVYCKARNEKQQNKF